MRLLIYSCSLRLIIAVLGLFFCKDSKSQNLVTIKVLNDSNPIVGAYVFLEKLGISGTTNHLGNFTFYNKLQEDNQKIFVSALGFKSLDSLIKINANTLHVEIKLLPNTNELKAVEVAVSYDKISKLPVVFNTDVISSRFMENGNACNLYEATGLVNGLRNQNTCNVCNTGEIQINGLPGPYTLILIDGMPIVSGLSSVYGIQGIPVDIIDKIEISKGPAQSLYGSEAMGGVINIVTKKPTQLDNRVSLHFSSNTWFENQLEFNLKTQGKKVNMLTSFWSYRFDEKIDKNNDGFTDLSLQNKASLFHKINFLRNNEKEFSLAFRAFAEDRWGGQIGWKKSYRGTPIAYGEHIVTKRAEIISVYDWNCRENITTQFSGNYHFQDSYYGLNPFVAKQHTTFIQTLWKKPLNRHNIMSGVFYKNLWFDDNTVVTYNFDNAKNSPQIIHSKGVFAQDEFSLDHNRNQSMFTGLRLEHFTLYNYVLTPRVGYKYSFNSSNNLRINAGKGFRITNVFAEDHMALTGARRVIFMEKLKPEESFCTTFNFENSFSTFQNLRIKTDLNIFYYYFTNKIVADYDTDPELIIYKNLDGYGISRGSSLNWDIDWSDKLECLFGLTYQQVKNFLPDANGIMVGEYQLFSPQWTGNFLISYRTSPKHNYKFDLNGNINGPMRLPVFPNDFRPEYSPMYSLFNFQISKQIKPNFSIYTGCKNILNFTPQNPIMRPFDPFDKFVNDPINNPNGYTFDPSYSYASMQGRRFYVGLRFKIK